MSGLPARAVEAGHLAGEVPLADEVFGLSFAHDAVLAVRPTGEIALASARAAALVGVAVEALSGRALDEVIAGADGELAPRAIVTARASGRRLGLEVERVDSLDLVLARLVPIAGEAARRALVERHDALVAEEARRRESVTSARAHVDDDRTRARKTLVAAAAARIAHDRATRRGVIARLEDPLAVLGSSLARAGGDHAARGLALVARVSAELGALEPPREEDEHASRE